MISVIIVFVVSSFSDVFDMFVYRKKVIIKILRCYKKGVLNKICIVLGK